MVSAEKTKTKDEKPLANGVKKDEQEELSEEDQTLKNELETLVERLKENDSSLYPAALESLKTLIRTSTSSMTAVPKPLKFLRPHYPDLKKCYEEWPPSPVKESLADVLSVLGMTYSDEETLDSLKYRLLAPTPSPADWGHEYVRHLASEIGIAFNKRAEKESERDNTDLLDLAKQLIPFLLSHNAEPDAVDLLSEIDSISLLPDYVDENTWERVVAYVVACVPLLTQDDDRDYLICARRIYKKYGKLVEAMTLSIRLDDMDFIEEDFADAKDDEALKRQLAFLLARNQIWFNPGPDESPEIDDCLRNLSLSTHFIHLVTELGVKEAKSPEDIYKSHLENSRPGLAGGVDSARLNLASTFVSGFVNAGMLEDKLGMTGKRVENDGEVAWESGGSWIWKNKDMGMLSATASQGWLYLWDVEDSINQIDPCIYADDINIQAGGLLATGMISSTVHNENDPALAILSEYIDSDKALLRATSIMGLGIAYTGSNRDDLKELLLPIVSDTSIDLQLSGMAALALGQIFIGQGAKADNEIASTMLQTLMEMDPEQLKSPWIKFYGLGLALLFFGKQDASDAIIETLKAIDHPVAHEAIVMLTLCSFAGTGEVLRIQQMLRLCAERPETEKDEEKKDAKKEDKKDSGKGVFKEGLAVLAIAAIAMGEDVGKELCMRHFGHLMHFGEPMIRKAVPLAIGLLYASNPQLTVFETLSRYSHDSDLDVAVNAIFAMGLVGAGTNNARIAQLLRGLASYYHREANCLFTVRIAQGMLHLGKGTLTLNPYHTDRQVLSRVSIAGLLPVLVAMMDSHHCTDPFRGPLTLVILGNYHWLLYYLTSAIRPRFLITFDEELKNLPVTVRVGQAVDTVGQAGKPKTITGFQTHSTPVLIGYGERAELATEEYISLASVLEGFVILKRNPEYMDEDRP